MSNRLDNKAIGYALASRVIINFVRRPKNKHTKLLPWFQIQNMKVNYAYADANKFNPDYFFGLSCFGWWVIQIRKSN